MHGTSEYVVGLITCESYQSLVEAQVSCSLLPNSESENPEKKLAIITLECPMREYESESCRMCNRPHSGS